MYDVDIWTSSVEIFSWQITICQLSYLSSFAKGTVGTTSENENERKRIEDQNKGGIELSYKRTLYDFVEDLVSDGKSFKQIRMIAAATRWSTCQDEIKEEYQKLRRRRKQLLKQN